MQKTWQSRNGPASKPSDFHGNYIDSIGTQASTAISQKIVTEGCPVKFAANEVKKIIHDPSLSKIMPSQP